VFPETPLLDSIMHQLNSVRAFTICDYELDEEVVSSQHLRRRGWGYPEKYRATGRQADNRNRVLPNTRHGC